MSLRQRVEIQEVPRPDLSLKRFGLPERPEFMPSFRREPPRSRSLSERRVGRRVWLTRPDLPIPLKGPHDIRAAKYAP